MQLKQILIGLFLSFTVTASAQSATIPNWHNMPAACTPARAVPWQVGLSEEAQAPCHCPPTTTCPTSTNIDNFVNNSSLPPSVTMKCCEPPRCPAGTVLAGKPVPKNEDCNQPEVCPNSMLLRGDYTGPYQNFEFGGARGPSLGTITATNVCLPPCDGGPYIVMVANSFANFPGGLAAAWDAEGVLYGTYDHNGTELLIACEQIVVVNDCLHGSSKVTLANGKSVAIETLKVGDVIKGPEGDVHVEAVNNLSARSSYYRINDFDFLITAEHPLQTKDGWKSASPTGRYKDVAGRLEIGDVLITDKGEVPVTSVVAVKEKGAARSVNIRVRGDAAFYVDGVVVKPFKDMQFTY